MKKNKCIKFILLIFLGILFLIWAIPYIHNEILTKIYGNEFKDRYKEISYFSADDKVELYKVVKYSNIEAKVYFVAEGNSNGILLWYVKNPTGSWVLKEWDCIWSDTGSASDILWPYFWYIKYGGI